MPIKIPRDLPAFKVLSEENIFDMDGTLWDSAAGVAESWNEAMRQTGYCGIVPTDVFGHIGQNHSN